MASSPHVVHVALLALLCAPAAAQEAAPSPTYGDVKQRLQQRLEQDARSSSVLQQSIDLLEEQVRQAVEAIEAMRAENDALRQVVSSLEGEMATVSAERAEALRGVQARLAATSGELDREREDAGRRESELDARIRELAEALSLERTGAEKLRSELETTRSELKATLVSRDAALAEGEKLRADGAAARSQLEVLAAVAAEERGSAVTKLAEARDALDRERTAAADARQRLDLLNRQIAALREQIAALNEALGASEAANREQKVAIADLGSRLNQALAGRVAELARYRSEFLGRLRIALGERSDVRIVGERFVFQSEVLFASGEADLNAHGREELQRFATTLKEVAAAIPPELDWVLRVDGHTDRRPISTPRFPSNWELSTARAISVVRFLAEEGVPPERLAATGFADNHPLDSREDEIGYRRNRRIEFLLTQR